VAPRSEDPKLIVHVIGFELTTYMHMIPQSYGQTDGRTTYDSNTTLALCASHGENCEVGHFMRHSAHCFLNFCYIYHGHVMFRYSVSCIRLHIPEYCIYTSDWSDMICCCCTVHTVGVQDS